ncbi:MAG: metal ABC transporter ATP-binding protein [Synergistaceae bacterium]|jgi:zinc transport system ATP-binding protein|nr:metal ABC transporter ATP-binding protein [Synergistaceae bacterium]
MALIACRNASFAYEGHVAAGGLSFTVNAGDYLCVVGENGSGKSTLLKGLLRLIAPRQGDVLTDGLRADEIGYLPQQTAAQKDFPAGVFEVVLSGCLPRLGLRPFYSRKEKTEARENLRRLGVLELRGRCYRELSGGQQKRVLLARALCAARKALLLDEPAAGLDPAAAQELYRTIRELNSSGLTVVMVTHDARCVTEYATHVLHLRNEQVFFGTAGDYARTDAGRRFLGGGAA